MSKSIRLDRLLANLGYGSRSEVQALLRRGGVTVEGKAQHRGEAKVSLAPGLREKILVDGEPLDPLPGLLLLLHKPLGVTCSHSDQGPLVYDLFPPRWQKRQPPLSTAGRLDKETSGLLLLTDDGDLLHRLSSPKQAIRKRYLAELARPLTGNEAEIFSSGTLLLSGEKKPLLPAELEILSPTRAAVTISEGRYHQVRRMFAAVGNHVESLHRESFGGLKLPETLAPGSFWALGEEERQAIFDCAADSVVDF